MNERAGEQGRPRPYRSLCCFLLGVSASFSQGVADQDAPQPLLFGMSTALSGPAGDLGRNMRNGVLCAFHEANRRGGVRGRRVHLRAVDDGYEPARTVPNVKGLIADSSILGMIGNVGTPTAIAAIPLVRVGKIPFFGAYTGAGILRRQPPERYVINYRASYAEETAAMVQALVRDARIAPSRIAFFTQRDGYGDAGFSGGVAALKAHGVKNPLEIPHGRYERNTIAVEGGLAELLQVETAPQAVIMVGAYAPCAAFIKLAHEVGFTPLFLNVSFVGAAPLARALGKDGEGVMITQVVPHYESQLPLVVEYRRALKSYESELRPSFGSLEGYIAGRILLRSLASMKGAATREKVIDALEALGRFDIGLGQALLLDAKHHQASHRVWPTIVRGGRVRPLVWAELAKEAGVHGR